MNQALLVLIVIGILFLAYWYLNRSTSSETPEQILMPVSNVPALTQPFTVSSEYVRSRDSSMGSPPNGPWNNNPLIAYEESPLDGIRPFLVDQEICSPQCCGDQWPTPFDGLTSSQVEATLATMNNDSGPFVRTNMTCANGPGGVGCPCVTKDTYRFITNHGRLPRYPQPIEPTFLIGEGAYYDPLEDSKMRLAGMKSPYVNNRKLNDLHQERLPADSSMNNVRALGSPLPIYQDKSTTFVAPRTSSSFVVSS